VRSIVFALLVAQELWSEQHPALFSVAEKHPDEKLLVTGFLISTWVLVFISGLRRTYPWLQEHKGLPVVPSANGDVYSKLSEVATYLIGLLGRGPPLTSIAKGIDEVLSAYSQAQGGFCFGVQNKKLY
jgi:hypothetical protein